MIQGRSSRATSWLAKIVLTTMLLTTVFFFVVGAESLFAQEPADPELLGPPVYFKEADRGLEDVVGLGDEPELATDRGLLPTSTVGTVGAPEPTSMVLFGAGCLLLAAGGRRRLVRR